ncbi:MAG: hypothetical protein AB3N13_01135 [Arenibacterium sp.]
MAQIVARKRGKPGNDCLWQIMGRKKPEQTAIASTNRMARTIYALLRDGAEFEAAKVA